MFLSPVPSTRDALEHYNYACTRIIRFRKGEGPYGTEEDCVCSMDRFFNSGLNAGARERSRGSPKEQQGDKNEYP
jgi:hypothetical protein